MANKKFILDEGGKNLDDLLYPGSNPVTETVKENPGKALLVGAAAVGIAAAALSKASKKEKKTKK